MKKLSALYYPFSRCITPASMKQMLLVFDELTFLDPVEDDAWRNKLLKDFERYDPQFSGYASINSELPLLFDEGCVRRIDPADLSAEAQKAAAASALDDLADTGWASVASNPSKFSLPSIPIQGISSWQIFRPKLPSEFIDGITSDFKLRKHLLEEGDDFTAWSISYAAGSAIGIGLHLEAAVQLGAAPITDSGLHHRLLLMKSARACSDPERVSPIPDAAIQNLTSDVALTMLSNILPEDVLQRATFSQILEFRTKTEGTRREFAKNVEERFQILKSVSTADDWRAARNQVIADLKSELRSFDAEFQANRDKIWPDFLTAMKGTVLGGTLGAGLGALLVSQIGVVTAGIAGTVAGATLDLVKSGLDRRASKNRLSALASPSIAYLSNVRKSFC